MKFKTLILILFYLFTCGLYFYFSHQPTNFHFWTTWDKFVPTIPIFIIPYLFATLMFLTFPLFLFIKAKSEIFYKYLITQGAASLISYLIFIIMPTSVVREPITQTGIFADALAWLHATDRPSAAFPSGHVFSSIIIAYFLWIYYPKTRVYVVITLPLIIASTVFLKQHYLPDILGGVLVSFVAINLGQLKLNLFDFSNLEAKFSSR